jgi:SnoaL-like domain
MDNASLEERIQRLEDLEAIRDLANRYAFNINKGWNGKTVGDEESMAPIFTDDVTYESVDLDQKGQGRAGLVTSMREGTASIDFSMHTFHSPVITLDGDTASATWLFWIGARTGDNARAVYLGAEMGYTRTQDGWRISAVLFQPGGMVLRAPAPAAPPK